MGQGHQPPQGPCAWERGNPKGEGLHLTWEALLPPLAAPQAPSRAGRTPWGGNPRWGRSPPPPLYIVEVWGCPRQENVSLSAQPFPLAPPPLPWCLAKPCWIATLLHHHHAVVLLLDGVFLNLSLSPCWIKAWETSPGCTCVERGGAVRSALDHR